MYFILKNLQEVRIPDYKKNLEIFITTLTLLENTLISVGFITVVHFDKLLI